MAKKSKTQKTTTTVRKRSMVEFCAFWGLAIVAVLFVVTAILNAIRRLLEINVLDSVITAFDVVAKVALLVAVGLPGFSYVRGRSTGWKVFFWVALIIYALGVVFSVIHW